MPADNTKNTAYSGDVNAPALGAAAITPAAGDLARPIRQLTIGTAAGTVVYKGLDGATYTTGPLPLGTYPLLAIAILTATTATGLTGWF